MRIFHVVILLLTITFSLQIIFCGENTPVKPFGSQSSQSKMSVMFQPSDKTDKLSGFLLLRKIRKISFYCDEKKKYVEVELTELKSMTQKIIEEKEEKEWRWKEGGNNEKMYTGRSYFWRKFGISFTLKDGSVLSGRLSAGFPLKFEWTELVKDDKGNMELKPFRKRFIIQPRVKGKYGEKPESLVYVKHVDFRPSVKIDKDTENTATKEPNAK